MLLSLAKGKQTRRPCLCDAVKKAGSCVEVNLGQWRDFIQHFALDPASSFLSFFPLADAHLTNGTPIFGKMFNTYVQKESPLSKHCYTAKDRILPRREGQFRFVPYLAHLLSIVAWLSFKLFTQQLPRPSVYTTETFTTFEPQYPDIDELYGSSETPMDSFWGCVIVKGSIR